MLVQLATIPGVELARTGQWSASTGVSTITRDDLAHAVEAMSCPAVRDPVVKLGHTDPRFDGEPAVGRITNLEVVDEYSLRGDLTGLPAWLGEVLASAYPSRSIEGEWNHRCQVGHTHDFVITGLALLGVDSPAIGNLSSIDDIAALYGVDDTTTIAEKGNTLGHNTIVASSATVEDIRRSYYDIAGWDLWIEEIQLAPLQLIVVNDMDGSRMRVPVAVNPDLDGAEAITFGEAVPVIVRYDDAPPPPAAAEPGAPVPVAASALRFASRADSQRDRRAGDNEGEDMAGKKIAAAAPGSGDATQSGLTDDQIAKLREAVGLTDEADADVLAAALEAAAGKVKTVPDEDATDTTTDDEDTTDTTGADAAGVVDEDDPEKKKVAASAAGKPGTVTVDAAQWEEVQAFMSAQRKRDAAERVQRADDMVDAAFKAGKIGRGSVVAYKAQARKDFDGTKGILDTLAASSAFPVGELGHSVDAEPTDDVTQNPTYKSWSI